MAIPQGRNGFTGGIPAAPLGNPFCCHQPLSADWTTCQVKQLHDESSNHKAHTYSFSLLWLLASITRESAEKAKDKQTRKVLQVTDYQLTEMGPLHLGPPGRLKDLGRHPHTAPASQGPAGPQVARNDLMSVSMFCRIEWGSPRIGAGTRTNKKLSRLLE